MAEQAKRNVKEKGLTRLEREILEERTQREELAKEAIAKWCL